MVILVWERHLFLSCVETVVCGSDECTDWVWEWDCRERDEIRIRDTGKKVTPIYTVLV